MRLQVTREQPPERPVPRGLSRQASRRELEQRIRRRAVRLLRCMQRRGDGPEATAHWLQILPATLKQWERRWEEDKMRKLRPRGRPVKNAEWLKRWEVAIFIGQIGPECALHHLERTFPDIARSELAYLLNRHRYIFRTSRCLLNCLDWQRVGAVWAMDFANLPCVVDGQYRRMLAVRDLASGMELFALPAEHADAETVRDALEALFRWCGAPLVIKSDNGSAFTSELLREFLDLHGVLSLFSPPGTPSYNGSAEAGIGSLEFRAHFLAAINGRCGEWTCDDIYAAREQANTYSRPRGLDGRTPAEVWSERQPITQAERTAFASLVRWHREKETQRRADEVSSEITSHKERSIDRYAITQALVESDYLWIRRRRVTSEVWRRVRTKIG